MGCASSRLEVEDGCPMPFKARPAFLNHRLDDIKTRKNSQTPTLTLSKKELLLREEEGEDHHVSSAASAHAHAHARRKSYSCDHENESCVTSEGGAPENNNTCSRRTCSTENPGAGSRNVKLELVTRPPDEGEGPTTPPSPSPSPSPSHSDDDDGDERMVRRKDGFPGSPSFRVYFNDTDLHDINKLGPGEVVFPEDIDIAKVDAHKDKVQVVECPLRQDKKQKRRRSFNKVLPRGGQAAMKNLLNVRSGMSSPHSTHRLLTPKTPAA